MSSRRILLAGSACIALSGCYTLSSPYRNIGAEDPAIGESVRYNAAVQTIDPDPVYAATDAQPGDNGDKGAQAVKRYRNDQVNARHRRESRAPSLLDIDSTSGSGSGSSGPR